MSTKTRGTVGRNSEMEAENIHLWKSRSSASVSGIGIKSERLFTNQSTLRIKSILSNENQSQPDRQSCCIDPSYKEHIGKQISFDSKQNPIKNNVLSLEMKGGYPEKTSRSLFRLTFSNIFSYFAQPSFLPKSQLVIDDPGSDETLTSTSPTESNYSSFNFMSKFKGSSLSFKTSSQPNVSAAKNNLSINRKSCSSNVYPHYGPCETSNQLSFEDSGLGSNCTHNLPKSSKIVRSSFDISSYRKIAVPQSKKLSRSLSREFEDHRNDRKNEAEHCRSHTRQIVETSRIYTRKQTGNTLISPTGRIETSQGQINQFHFFERIGDGSYGQVVRAYDEITKEYFACKIISKSRLIKKFRFHAGNRNEKIRKMKQEVAVLKKVSNHPKIIKLHEVLDDEEDDNLYLFFELCERGPVMTMQIGSIVPYLDENKAREIFRDVVLGLEFLHFKGIIHCDLKPENIFLTANGEVQIGDFGISMILDNAAEDDTIENQNSSPLFTSPSALTERVIQGKSADIWALGVTLFCFVHGYCPFEDENIVFLYEKIQNDTPVYKSSISDSLRELLECMLNKDSRKRITIDKIKTHPWVVEKAGPLPTREENCFDTDSILLTSDEIEHVFKPVTFVNKIMNSFQAFRKVSINSSSK